MSGRDLGWTNAWLPFKIAEGATAPAIPLLATALGATAAMVGTMEFFFSIAMMWGGYVWGRTSDEGGKRKAFLLSAFFIASASITGLALAPGFASYALSRTAMGFALAGIPTLGGAMVASRLPAEQINSGVGRLNAVGTFGYTLGLIVAGILVTDLLAWDLSMVFLAAGLTGTGSCILAAVMLDDGPSVMSRVDLKRMKANALAPLRGAVQRLGSFPSFGGSDTQRRARAYLTATVLHFAGTGAVMMMLPLYLSSLGVRSSIVFAVFFLHAAVAAIAFSPAGSAADAIGCRDTQVGALSVRASAFALLALPLTNSIPGVMGALTLVGLTFAALVSTGPSALFRSMPVREDGELAGFYHAASAGGLAIGGLVGGFSAGFFGFQALFLIAAALTLVSASLTVGKAFPAQSGDVWPLTS